MNLNLTNKLGGVILKKSIATLLTFLLVFGSLATPSFAEKLEETSEMPSVEQQIQDFKNFEENLQLQPDKEVVDTNSETDLVSTLATTTGTYPSRRGTILVTDGLQVDSLVGHAGMVLGPTYTIESFPSGGVQIKFDNWTSRYGRVWGISAKSTTLDQDASAADWSVAQNGKPYNYIFGDIDNLDKFYCSQLVYKAFKMVTGVDINWMGGVVTPADLVNSDETFTFYTYLK
jgi:uncharacterized protein YycO